MALTLLKLGLIGGIACGLVATAVTVPVFAVSGWTEVLLVAKSKNDKVKLYLQAKADPETGRVEESKPKVYELKAQYEGKEIKEKLMLCSPDKNKDKYFLLKLTSDGAWKTWKTLDDKSEKKCSTSLYSEEDSFGDALSIKFQQESNFPKEIYYLQSCEISSLETGGADQGNLNGKSQLVIKCSEDEYKRKTTDVKILDQGLFYI